MLLRRLNAHDNYKVLAPGNKESQWVCATARACITKIYDHCYNPFHHSAINFAFRNAHAYVTRWNNNNYERTKKKNESILPIRSNCKRQCNPSDRNHTTKPYIGYTTFRYKIQYTWHRNGRKRFTYRDEPIFFSSYWHDFFFADGDWPWNRFRCCSFRTWPARVGMMNMVEQSSRTLAN